MLNNHHVYKRSLPLSHFHSSIMDTGRTTSPSKLFSQYIVKSNIFNLSHAMFDDIQPIDIETLRSLDELRKRCFKILHRNQIAYTTWSFSLDFMVNIAKSLR